ncbi:MAG: MBL fold metallo-hydrolase RNA specificity domain-containing protein [Chloroflexota bacterium]|nr:MBL fold metallo-hydrolase RNA specificity domain-containing protein [Chloroflexota bacterium]
MVTLTCYGGVGEIGGNQLFLEDGETRLFLDFGTPYSRWNDYYEEYMKPRPGAGLLDVLELGLLPPLRGLYRPDLEFPDRMWERFRSRAAFRDLSDRPIAGVLVTHAHLDHCGYVSFLRADMPVFATAATAFTIKAMQDTGGGSDFEREVAYYAPKALKDDHLSAEQRGARRQRPFALLDGDRLPIGAIQFWNAVLKKETDRKTKEERFFWKELEGLAAPGLAPRGIGGLPLRWFPVDHSVLGACAYAVETSAGWLGYTGDLRFHGAHHSDTEVFVQRLASLKPAVMVCEGTNVEHGAGVTEAEVSENCLRAVRAANGRLVIADFAPRNMERLAAFLEIAKATGRRLVALAKDAYILEHLAQVGPGAPSLEASPEIAIYQDPKDAPGHWEQELRARHAGRMVDAQDVRREPGAYILCFSYWDLKNLIDIEPHGAHYIYSTSEAHSEEQKIDLERLRRWIAHFQMTFVGDPDVERGFHASGHASGDELLAMIRAVQPRILVPVHTQQPERFVEALKGTGIQVVPPAVASPIALG